MPQAAYRNLHRYKYQLVEDYLHDIAIQNIAFENPYLKLQTDGLLTIHKGYAWDGPSGPTIDTLDFMRGSLVHDALYQLIRLESIPYPYKDHADRLLQKICKEDGMSSFRAWYVYQSVKLFGGDAAKPGTDKPIKIIHAPKNA